MEHNSELSEKTASKIMEDNSDMSEKTASKVKPKLISDKCGQEKKKI